MTKSPFEIRENLLHFASSHLTSEYYAQIEKAREIADQNLKLDMMSKIKYPTVEDIFELAEKFKAFVDRK